jgi:tetratricopeptide (TPR) repeat protein
MKHTVLNMAFLILTLLFLTHTGIAESVGKSALDGQKDIETKLEEARRVYFDYYKDSMNLDRSIGILEEVIKRDPDNIDALLFLSRVWLTYGYAKAPNDKEKIRVFKNGFEAAKRAIELDPENADSHFLYVANLGSWAETNGVLRSLFLLPKIRREIERTLELNPNHVYGLAMYGLLYYALPGFMGGDLHISEVYLRRAISIDPHLTTLKIHLAKTLIKQKKYDEAKKTLKEIIEEKNPTVYADWYLNKEMAEKMIARIEEKEKRLNHNGSLIHKD